MIGFEYSSFIVIAHTHLTNTERILLSKLYQPFIGPEATNLYITLHDLVRYEAIESEEIDHTRLLVQLNLKSAESLSLIREKLEACGLLETYQNNNLTIYYVKDILRPVEFFNDILLSTLLRQSVGIKAFEQLISEMVVTSRDLNNYQNISKAFDDVYSIDLYEKSQYDKWWTSVKKTRPHLLRTHFDYEMLLAKIEPLELFDLNVTRSTTFYELMNSISFCYGLSVDEIEVALRRIVKISKEFDEKAFIKEVKKIYDKKQNKENIEIVPIRKTSENSEVIEVLENTPYSALVNARFGKGLVSSEIELLERLHRKHNFSHGFINVLLIYVLEQTKGSVPAFNYFLKIANEWYRRGIRNTKQALDYITNPEANSFERTVNKTNKKHTPDWMEQHLEDTKTQNTDDKTESISDLEDYFNNK